MEVVKVINRTKKPVEFQHDQQTYAIAKEMWLPIEVARHGMKRTTFGEVCVLGIEGQTDCSALEATELVEAGEHQTLVNAGGDAKKVKRLRFRNVEAQAEARQRAGGSPDAVDVRGSG